MIKSRMLEDLSIAYLSAIAAQASVDFQTSKHDEDSVDGLLKKEILLDDGTTFRSSIHVQLKSTASSNYYTIDETTVTYKLKRKNYDDLRKAGSNFILLFLLILPEESEKPWVECTNEELLLHGRMFWCSLRNEPEATQKDRVPIKVPKDQFLDPTKLDELMFRVSKGGPF